MAGTRALAPDGVFVSTCSASPRSVHARVCTGGMVKLPKNDLVQKLWPANRHERARQLPRAQPSRRTSRLGRFNDTELPPHVSKPDRIGEAPVRDHLPQCDKPRLREKQPREFGCLVKSHQTPLDQGPGGWRQLWPSPFPGRCASFSAEIRQQPRGMCRRTGPILGGYIRVPAR